MQLPLKSSRRKKVTNQNYIYRMFYMYLCNCLYWHSVFFVIQVTLRCPFLYFSLKDSLSIFIRQIGQKNFFSIFVYLGMFKFHLHFLKYSYVKWRILGWYYFLSVPWICHTTAFRTSWFLMGNQLLILLGVLPTWPITSLLRLSRVSVFDYNV